MANGSFLEGNEGNMEEIGARTRREPSCFFFLRAFPRGEIILEVLEMPGTPEKQKRAAATITKQIQELAKRTGNGCGELRGRLRTAWVQGSGDRKVVPPS